MDLRLKQQIDLGNVRAELIAPTVLRLEGNLTQSEVRRVSRRVERTCRVLRRQEGIEDAHRFAELSLALCGSKCREAATMVVTELAENMVKYSDPSATFAGTIALAVEGDCVRVAASNEVASAIDAERVARALEGISASNDLKTLYEARVEVLYQNPGLAKTQLGLLRAAYEAGFRLSCCFEAPMLTIIAERDAR